MSRIAAFNQSPDSGADEIEAIFLEHYRMVYRTACGVTGSAEEAEDVVQTLFLRLLRTGVPADFRKNPKGYLYRATINQALNAVRSKSRQAKIFDSAGLEHAAAVPAIAEERPYELERRKRVVKALAQLNRRAVEMVILRYHHQYNETEIAQLFGTSRGVVAVTLWRARVRLRALLNASTGDRPLEFPRD